MVGPGQDPPTAESQKEEDEHEEKEMEEDEEGEDVDEAEEGDGDGDGEETAEGTAGGSRAKRRQRPRRTRRRSSGRRGVDKGGVGDGGDRSGHNGGRVDDSGDAGGSGDASHRRDGRQQPKRGPKTPDRRTSQPPPQQQQETTGSSRRKNSKEGRLLDPNEPQDALLLALLRRDIHAFEKALAEPGVNPHFLYGLCRISENARPQRFHTCLELAAADPKANDFVRALLNDASPQVQEVRPTPLHVAVRSGAAENVEQILQHKRVRVNEVDAKHWTPLHTLMHFYRPEHGYRRCLELLLERRDLDVNVQDEKKKATPLHVGARRRQWEALRTLLQSRGSDVDADGKISLGRTVREAIADRFLDLLHLLPPFQRFTDEDAAAPAMRLLAAMQRDDLTTFEHLLSLVDEDSGPVIDEDYVFDRPVSGTCLHIACTNPRKVAFVEALLRAGASPARPQPRNRRNALHIAAGALNAPAIEVMFDVTRNQLSEDNSPIVLNEFMLTAVQATEAQGRTPLHMVCDSARPPTEGAALAVVRLLRRALPIDALMVRDNMHITPRQLAEANGAFHVARLLPPDEKSRVEPIPEIGPVEPIPPSPTDDGPASAGSGGPAPFRALLIPEVPPEGGSVSPGGSPTALRKRMLDIPRLRRLVSGPGSVPGLLPGVPGAPAVPAAAPVPPTVPPTIAQLQNLLESGNRGEFWRALQHAESSCGSSYKRELVSALLPKAAELRKPTRVIRQLVERGADVDAADAKGRTALYFAARHPDPDMVAYLLQMGADPRKQSVLGHRMLPSQELRFFLDNSLSANNFPGSEDYEVVFDLQLLLQPSLRQFCDVAPAPPPPQNQLHEQRSRTSSLPTQNGPPERPPVVRLSSLHDAGAVRSNAKYSTSLPVEKGQNNTDDNQPLLGSATTPSTVDPPPPSQPSKLCMHPPHIVLPETQFLHNLTHDDHYHDILQHPIILSYIGLKWKCLKRIFYCNLFCYTLFVILLNFYFVSLLHWRDPYFWLIYVVRVGIWILLAYFGVREIVQFLAAGFQKYTCHYENYLDLAILGMIIYVEVVGPEQPNEGLFVYILVFSAIELLLMLGRVPALSRNIEMLKVVCKSYGKFLMTYIILILAFANCFFILFFKHSDYGQTQKMKEKNITGNSWMMMNVYPFFHPLSRTIVMMTGEYEAKDLFQENIMPFTAELMLIIFVFFISIVLCNLLLGLTVDDSQAIRKQSEILSVKSRIEMIYEIELYAIGFVKIAKRCCFPSVIHSMEKQIMLFHPSVKNKMIYTLPNQQGKIILTEKNTVVFNSKKLGEYRIKSSILDDALKVLRCKEGQKNREKTREVDLHSLQNSINNLTKIVETQASLLEDLTKSLGNQGQVNEE